MQTTAQVKDTVMSTARTDIESLDQRDQLVARHVVACIVALLALLTVTPASAAAPEFLLQIPADSIAPGPNAGQLSNPRGIVADPDSGHLYVAENANGRISEFTAWGVFVKAWGWDVAPEGAPGDTVSNQLEICTTSCQAGSEGSGVGQFNRLTGIALDDVGDVYVYDRENLRVQKFSSAGEFLLMFGGEVNQGPSNPGGLCTSQHITEGDTCGVGTLGTSDGWFSNGSFGNYLAYNSITDSVFVGDKDRIQEFGTDGKFEGKIDFEGPLAIFDGQSVGSLAADPINGHLYFSLNLIITGSPPKVTNPNTYRIDANTSELLDTLDVERPRALTVDVDGSAYVIDDDTLNDNLVDVEVLGFDSDGTCILGLCPGDGFAAPPQKPNPEQESLNGLATNVAGSDSVEVGNLYVSYFRASIAAYINAYGPPPIAFEDPPLAPPEISDQYAASADTDSALLKAKINPRFWADTTYRVQYATEACIKAEGWGAACASEEPASPGALLTAKSTNSFLTAPGFFIGGLEPDTLYRYRFVARSSGSEGEDVIGVGGKPGAPGEESAFSTFPLPNPSNTGCANQAFRIGPGAKLPDCRAYEMVSPAEKGSADILAPPLKSLHQAAPTGDALAYTSATAFGEVDSAPAVSQYIADRDPETGWSSEVISPLRSRLIPDVAVTAGVFDNEFKAFSPDLCTAWLRTATDPPLTADALPINYNVYRRSNCEPEAGFYEALTNTAHDPGVTSTKEFSGLKFQGASANAAHALYVANQDLPETGAPAQAGAHLQLYEHVASGPEAGTLRYVCVLPDGKNVNPANQSCYPGWAQTQFLDGREGNLANAISADGERIFWAVSANTAGGNGKLFVRIGGTETIAVSKDGEALSGTSASTYWGAAKSGARTIFSTGDFFDGKADLYSFEVDTETTTPIAEKVHGVLGTSDDATRVYFASEEALAGSGENSEGDEAEEGEPNLYLYEQGEPATYTFIGTLGGLDTDGSSDASSTLSPRALEHTARVSSDGSHAAFMSTARLTDYDNTDAVSGKPANEVFLYDAEEGELHCVSCNRSGVRPTGGELRTLTGQEGPTGVWAAAKIPGWETPFHASRVLSEDGSRLFFESHEALVLRDTNGAQDVYQWEEAGTGSCEEESSVFDLEAGGCVELISSGESPRDAIFIDASPNGKDVFFSTLSSLISSDSGLVDIYDARMGGGFPGPASKPTCEGEACQGPVAAPNDPTAGSSSFEGAGNVTEAPRPTKCAKGRKAVRKAGKTRCVKKPRKAKRAKRANTKRRAAR